MRDALGRIEVDHKGFECSPAKSASASVVGRKTSSSVLCSLSGRYGTKPGHRVLFTRVLLRSTLLHGAFITSSLDYANDLPFSF